MRWERNQLDGMCLRGQEARQAYAHANLTFLPMKEIIGWHNLLGAEVSWFEGGTDVSKSKLLFLPIHTALSLCSFYLTSYLHFKIPFKLFCSQNRCYISDSVKKQEPGFPTPPSWWCHCLQSYIISNVKIHVFRWFVKHIYQYFLQCFLQLSKLINLETTHYFITCICLQAYLVLLCFALLGF